jgi:hypothetical protein
MIVPSGILGKFFSYLGQQSRYSQKSYTGMKQHHPQALSGELTNMKKKLNLPLEVNS